MGNVGTLWGERLDISARVRHHVRESNPSTVAANRSLNKACLREVMADSDDQLDTMV